MNQTVEIRYTPRQWALKSLHKSAKQFIVLVVHRRGGKTTAALHHLNRDALRKPGRYAYIAPLRNQAKRIAWEQLKAIVRTIPGVSINESELKVTYASGATIELYGGDNPDALRGIGLMGVVLDEYAQMSPLIFSEIVTKCVADTGGYIIIIGTPKGKGHFHRIYTVAEKSENWDSAYRNIDDSLKNEKGFVIDNLRNALKNDRQHVADGLMTQEEFDQEWYLSWEAALKGAVYAKQIAEARRGGRIGTVPYDEELKVFTVWDLGMSDSMSIGFYQKPSAREIHKIDYYENTGLGLTHYAGIVSKKPYVYGKHYFPFDIKNRELSTGKTRLDAVEKLFGRDKVEVVPSIGLEDGLDLGRAMWRRLWVDEKACELWLDLIGSYVYEYDEKRGVFRKKPIHDFTSHAADEYRYAAIIEDDMLREGGRDAGKEKKTPPPPPVDDEYMGDQVPEWVRDEDDPLPSKDDLSKM